MGLFKEISRGIQNKPWIPFAKKTVDSEQQAPGLVEEAPKIKKSFCDPDANMPCVTVCVAKSGCRCGCEGVRKALDDEIARRELNIVVGDAKTGCSGNCKNGALIGFPQKGFFYINVHPEEIPEIIEETVVHGRILFPHISINPDRSYRADVFYERETGLIAAINDRVCMVELAKYFLDFEEGLSCGKCAPCRIGLKRMQERINRIISGKGVASDLEEIKSLCETMKITPYCDFAMTSSRPVLSAITYFEDEFRAHIERQVCPTGVCKELVELQRKKAVRERLRKKKKGE
jgi:(2Fe-2S) ferredoxin